MSIFGRFFKADGDVSTSNSQIINVLKILQNGKLPYSERVSGLTKLKSIFLTSNNKDDWKAISQSILLTARNDRSIKIREIALTTFDTIIEMGGAQKASVVSRSAVPILKEIAENNNEDAKDLRQMAFKTMLKVAHFGIDDELLSFFAHSLNDNTDSIKLAVIHFFENRARSADDTLKRRIVKVCLPSLCAALNDSAIWTHVTMTLGELGKFALGAAPFLYNRLDDEQGELAAAALRQVTGKDYGRKDKKEWDEWLKRSVVK
jgi:hypothetical protein